MQQLQRAIKDATVARNVRLEMEEVIGEKEVNSLNYKSIHKSIENKNEKNKYNIWMNLQEIHPYIISLFPQTKNAISNKYKTGRPDLIHLNMKMPIMEGLEATQKIREIDRRIPIIMLTAFVYDDDQNEAIKY